MQASNHSNKELFYFPASVRLDISDKAHYLLDEVRQHCFFEIIPQILAVCVVLLLLLHHTALVLVCFAGMKSHNVVFFFAQELGINVTLRTFQDNVYFSI